MTYSSVGHAIRWDRRGGGERDDFATPDALARTCVGMVPITPADTACDPFRGGGAFHRNLPVGSGWFEIKDGRDFFASDTAYDWLVSNPPYSRIDDVLSRSADVSVKGFGYLLAAHAVTPRRIEAMESAGFGLAIIHLCKVFRWYGMSAFCLWLRGAKSVVTYDRTVWR